MLMLVLSSCLTEKDCVCPEYYSPVCGSNGKTYANPCMAECDDVEYIEGECPVYGIGIVRYYDTLQNGCGYLIEILNEKYKPLNLSEPFQQNDLFVTLRYRKLNDYFICEFPDGNFRRIEILEIQSYTD